MDRSSRVARGLQPALLAVTAWWLAGCASPQIAEVYPQLTEHAGREIEEVDFANTDPFTPDSLDALTETEETECTLVPVILPFCFPGTDWGLKQRFVDLRMIGQDVARMNLLYRQSGYFGTRVVPEIEDLVGEDGAVLVRFRVERGDGVIVDSVVVEGTEGIADPDSLEQVIPLQSGELFDIRQFLQAADTVRETLRSRGHAYAEVLRNYSVDTLQNRAAVWLVAVPGPRVVVDSVIITGTDQLTRGTTLRYVPFRTGDRLRLRELQVAQRNLYELELVQFASVVVAPDSLQLTPEDRTTATVLVQVNEAAEHVVEAAAGYGTVECFRTSAQWTDRSLFRGPRRLTLTGSLSRIGVGGATDVVGSDFCPAQNQEFAGDLDYRVSGELTQPYFLSPRNQLTLGGFTERQSEPGLFQRTAQGGRFYVTHRIDPREALTASLDAERRRTEAVPALYCFAFSVCQPEDIRELGRARWRNALGVSWLRDRGNNAVNPTSGYVVRAATQWATPLLGSDYDFLRMSTDGSVYRPLGPNWVLAARLRVGSFVTDAAIGSENFIAPEERFFAGGASSVRGYTRNELGPGIWLFSDPETPPDSVDPTRTDLPVDFVPSGGTAVAVASAELRFPSPLLRDLLRLVVFIDAGTVGLDPLWKLNSQWRATPGVGLRIRTPVGPARVDLAYNPYPRQRAPLFVRDPETDALRRLDPGYRPDDPSFFQRFRIHVAVGQAF